MGKYGGNELAKRKGVFWLMVLEASTQDWAASLLGPLARVAHGGGNKWWSKPLAS
jgi:hypothetical protein